MHFNIGSATLLLASGFAAAFPIDNSTVDGAENSIIHTVVVGSTSASKILNYTPNNITAKVGDIVQFQFSMDNHTVTQSSFDAPCTPIKPDGNKAPGVNSGFVPVGAKEASVHTFDVQINDTNPIYIYCGQANHCQQGMLLTVNAAGDKDLDAYKEAASKAAKNVPGEHASGAVFGTIAAADAVPPPQ